MVKDINPGAPGSDLWNFLNINGTLYFVATDGSHGRELWKSDGTADGTVQVADLRQGPKSSEPGSLVNINGTLFFSADDGRNGAELWKFVTGTAGGSTTALTHQEYLPQNAKTLSHGSGRLAPGARNLARPDYRQGPYRAIPRVR